MNQQHCVTSTVAGWIFPHNKKNAKSMTTFYHMLNVKANFMSREMVMRKWNAENRRGSNNKRPYLKRSLPILISTDTFPYYSFPPRFSAARISLRKTGWIVLKKLTQDRGRISHFWLSFKDKLKLLQAMRCLIFPLWGSGSAGCLVQLTIRVTFHITSSQIKLQQRELT